MGLFQVFNVFLEFQNPIDFGSFIKDFEMSIGSFEGEFESFREDITKFFVEIFVGGVEFLIDVFQNLFLDIFEIGLLGNLDNGLQESGNQLKLIGR
jgi:hypothetical protein